MSIVTVIFGLFLLFSPLIWAHDDSKPSGMLHKILKDDSSGNEHQMDMKKTSMSNKHGDHKMRTTGNNTSNSFKLNQKKRLDKSTPC